MQAIIQRVKVPKISGNTLFWNQEQQVVVDDQIRLSTGEIFPLTEVDKVIKIVSKWSPFWAYTDCANFQPHPWDYLIKRAKLFHPDLIPIFETMEEDDVLYLGEATLNETCCGGLLSKTLFSREKARELVKRLKAISSTLPYGAVLEKIN